MATDATSALAETATTTSTEAPAVAEATQTTPPAQGAQTSTPAPAAAATAASTPPELKGMAKGDHRANVLASLAAKREAAGKQPDKPAEAQATAPAATEPDKPTAEPEKPAAPEDEELKAARLLNEAAQANQRIRARIKQAEEKERQIAEREQRTQAEAARLAEEQRKRDELMARARQSGRELDILRAAGVSEERLRGDFFLNALAQITEEPGQAQTAQPEQKPLTEAEIKEIIKLEREAALKEAAEKQRTEGEAAFKASQARYFSVVEQEFARAAKAGDLPLVRAVRPTMHELNEELLRHRRETGVALPPAELLKHFEERYKAAGITIAKPATPAKPRPAAPAAPARTISSAATSDAGTTSPPPEAPKQPRTARDIREEGFKKWQESKGRRVSA